MSGATDQTPQRALSITDGARHQTPRTPVSPIIGRTSDTYNCFLLPVLERLQGATVRAGHPGRCGRSDHRIDTCSGTLKRQWLPGQMSERAVLWDTVSTGALRSASPQALTRSPYRAVQSDATRRSTFAVGLDVLLHPTIHSLLPLIPPKPSARQASMLSKPATGTRRCPLSRPEFQQNSGTESRLVFRRSSCSFVFPQCHSFRVDAGR
jgi:hypothetical protein